MRLLPTILPGVAEACSAVALSRLAGKRYLLTCIAAAGSAASNADAQPGDMAAAAQDAPTSMPTAYTGERPALWLKLG